MQNLPKIVSVCIFVFIILPSFALANNDNEKVIINKKTGWNYLKDNLVDYGIPKYEVYKVFNDKRFPEFTAIPFKVSPSESKASYKHFYHAKYIDLAREILTENKISFEVNEKFFKVDKHVVASILLVETQYGNYTGNRRVFYRLARIASVKEPSNLAYNFARLKKKEPETSYGAMVARANYLEDTFLPEVVALFDFSKLQNTDILSIKGSVAGAFGIPQFLPRSYLKFSVDGNKDKTTSLFNINDAIASTSNFLAYYGWNNNLSREAKELIIWNYNKSKAYTSTVIEIANILKNTN